MAREDTASGPKIGHMVIFNNSGTLVPGVINQVNANGSVGILAFIPAGAAQQSNVLYDPNFGSGKYAYPEYL